MFTIRWLALVLPFQVLLPILVFGQATQSPAPASRIQLALNADEAESVLAILDKHSVKGNVTDDDWQHLFATEPYQQLKKREASLHRDFTDDDFKKFVMSPELAAKASSLRHTLDTWRQADLEASARRVLDYLPGQAHIKAKIFPMIKPKTNSFVFETTTNPMIFLYLDQDESAAAFENTVAHELHHIGLASVDSQIAAKVKDLPANVRPAVDWMSAFGEGFAMLAAAGGPDVDAHATSSPADRVRWEHDLSNFNQNLELLQDFFLDVIHQKIKGKDQIDERAFTFFGVQGPWYTVGYKMAVVVEKRYGRKRLIECMLDPRDLLATYNKAAAEINKSGKENLALWSPQLMQEISAPAASKKHSPASNNKGVS
jgi:hypothetical protein